MDSASAMSQLCIQATEQHLLDLPPDILTRLVLQPYLSYGDLAALRQTSRLGRQLANAAVLRCVVDAYDDNSTACEQIPNFCNLQELHIRCTPPAPAAADTAGELLGSSSSRLFDLQQQLPRLVSKLPCLCQLAYEGPRDRRQQGLDMTAAVQALATAIAAGAAATAAQATAGATAAPPPPLRVLDLCAGSLSEQLMEAVGQLHGLVSLRLTATAALHMTPVAQLTGLTSLTCTVTPPLPAALSPLSRLTRLKVLHLSALSPARGWGPALARLSPCPLESLTLAFADVCDDDMQHIAAALGRLTLLNLNYSRHLTAAALRHIACLKHLRALHLEETGVTLRPSDMALLGTSTPHLATLEASFSARTDSGAALTLYYLCFADLNTGMTTYYRDYGREAHVSAVQQQLLACVSSDERPAARSSSSSIFGIADSSENRALLQQIARDIGLQRGAPWPQRLTQLVVNSATVEDLALLLLMLPSLRRLHLAYGETPSLQPYLMKCLAALAPQLEALSLPALCVSAGCDLPGIVRSRAPWLKQLSLVKTALSAGLYDACCEAKLQCLLLSRCFLYNGDLQHQLGRISSLRQLELVGCRGFDGDALVCMAGQLPQLTRLVVRDCSGVGPEARRAWECAAAAAAAAARAAAGSGSVGVYWPPKQELVFEGRADAQQ